MRCSVITIMRGWTLETGHWARINTINTLINGPRRIQGRSVRLFLLTDRGLLFRCVNLQITRHKNVRSCRGIVGLLRSHNISPSLERNSEMMEMVESIILSDCHLE